MLISPGLLERSAEPVRKDGPNRRNREPSAFFRFSPSPPFFLVRRRRGRRKGGFFSFAFSLDDQRSIDPSLAETDPLPSLSPPLPPYSRTHRRVAPRSNINFAATTFRHPPFLPLRDPYGNGDRSSESSLPVWETSPTGREEERERGRERSTAFPFLLLRKRGG